ncbi:MAG: carbamoyltransferase HypF [Anaerolineaceae bacterium]|nr:carbamoyltransferase HypF [Anaerolineaceae bacterium]
MNPNSVGRKIKISGTVQGVGFRPFVYAQALRFNLTGWVRNTSLGVEIHACGGLPALEAFTAALQHDLPPLARIDQFEKQTCPPGNFSQFEIIASQAGAGDFVPITPDIAICDDCQRELFDPADRRFGYPFINCTNCGPRFSIIQDIPYDRPHTTMSGFEMCPNCRAEYENPLDRRFHAQPIACPQCGPHVWLELPSVDPLISGKESIAAARNLIKAGKILAIKGLGGFHLACDAANPQAVDTLRLRKQRSDKPFGLMAFDLETIERHCHLSDEETRLLSSRERPIVLLERRNGSSVAAEAAPGQPTLGVMLAYTPLHLLLLQPENGYSDLWVMTSGNLSEEPIAYQDEEARQRLSPLADGFLMHNRPIHMRVDDSVARIAEHQPFLIRRSRGFAPQPIRLPFESPPLFAAGAELKNTFCLARKQYAFLSHHIGDLQNYETLAAYEAAIPHFERLFRIQPRGLVCDLHPDYLATRYARQRSEDQQLELLQVQHHHAHLAACLADNDWNSDEAVIGLCFDGTGYGTDGAIWGGEVLLGNYRQAQRKVHLAYVPQPGGDLAVHKPARMALAHLWQAGLDWEPDLPSVQALCAEERTVLRSQLDHKLNTPQTSSMGRLFDAASSLLGVCQKVTYEGQAAIWLENAADPAENGHYDLEIEAGIVNPGPLWSALIADWRAGVSLPRLSARFHNSLAHLAAKACRVIRQETDVGVVALSGGVWQNRLLLERSLHHLRQDGFKVLLHQQAPTNDGGVSLGQIMIAIANGIGG